MKKLINQFSEKPKSLFLIDSAGAFMTAFTLFVIMRQFNTYFGMPENELTYLSILAVLFCTYSSACYIFIKSDLRPFLRLIGLANLFYCAFTIALIIKNYHLLTVLATTYFFIEISIILGLSFIELSVANKIKQLEK
jgi:hypothetical protein